MTLTILLANAFNAPWPKEFNPESFILPDNDLTKIEDSIEIEEMDEEDQTSMATTLLQENEEIRGSKFWNTYLFPIHQTLNPKRS